MRAKPVVMLLSRLVILFLQVSFVISHFNTVLSILILKRYKMKENVRKQRIEVSVPTITLATKGDQTGWSVALESEGRAFESSYHRSTLPLYSPRLSAASSCIVNKGIGKMGKGEIPMKKYSTKEITTLV